MDKMQTMDMRRGKGGASTQVDLYYYDGVLCASAWGNVGDLAYIIDYYRNAYPHVAHYLCFWDKGRIAVGQGHDNQAWSSARTGGNIRAIIPITHASFADAAELLLGERLSDSRTGWINPVKHDRVTTTEAAKMLAVASSSVAWLCRQGASGPFPGAVKQGRDWLIPREEVETYAARDRKPGPKTGGQ